MTEKLNKSISEVLPDFFSKNQVDEFIQIYQTSVSESNKDETFKDVKQLEYNVEN